VEAHQGGAPAGGLGGTRLGKCGRRRGPHIARGALFGKLGDAIDRLVFHQPFDAGFRMKMQKGCQFGGRHVAGGDHGSVLMQGLAEGNCFLRRGR